eukprot:Clim_evm7s109 gene=Clim_evmTU7s109
MSKASKATKRFRQKHLQKKLQVSNQKKKVAKLHGKNKKLAQIASKTKGHPEPIDSESDEGDATEAILAGTTGAALDDDTGETSAKVSTKKRSSVGEMDIDDFLANGLDEDEADGSDADEDEEEDDVDDDLNDELENPLAGLGIGEGEEETGKRKVSKKSKDLHQTQLDRLKEKDPEFYKFLKENDAGLLNFDGEDSDEDEGSDEESPVLAEDNDNDEELDFGGDDDAGETPKQPKAVSVDPAEAKRVCVQAFERGGVVPLRRAVAFFHAAVHAGDAEDKYRSKLRFHITNASSFRIVVLACLSGFASAALEHLGETLKEKTPKYQVCKKLQKNAKWQKFRSTAKVFCQDYVHFLNTVIDEDMMIFSLTAGRSLTPFLLCFPRTRNAYLKTVLKAFEASSPSVIIAAYLLIRDMALAGGNKSVVGLEDADGQIAEIRETCLKAVYVAFIKNMRGMSMARKEALTVMENCCLDALTLDPALSYKVCFVYVRQTAVHLRSVLTSKKKDAAKSIYNWQILSSIRVFCRLLSMVTIEEQRKNGPFSILQPLIYPVCQIAIGVIRLRPSSVFFPARLRIIVELNALSKTTGTYIPLQPLLLSMLESAEIRRKPVGTQRGLRAMDLDLTIKCSKAQVRTRAFQDAIWDGLYLELLSHLNNYACSIAFPEMFLLTRKTLRRFSKQCKNSTLSRQAAELAKRIDENAAFVRKNRNGVEFSPIQVDKVAAWEQKLRTTKNSPLEKYYTMYVQQQEMKAGLIKQSIHNGQKARFEKDDESDEDDGEDQANVESNSSVEEDDEDGMDKDEEADVAGPTKGRNKTKSSFRPLTNVDLDDDDDIDDEVDDFDINDL